jgi:hypothetical protein
MYSPAGGAGIEIREAKAWPADTSKTIFQGLSACNAACVLIPFALLALSSATAFAQMNLRARWDRMQAAHTVTAALFFSPHLFFRPPPAR